MVGDAATNPQFLTHVDLVRMVDGVEYTNGLYLFTFSAFSSVSLLS